MITARVLCDSMHPNEVSRLTTFELTYPRFIHAEFMTHRCFSRNAASSRAIPVTKMLAKVKEDPHQVEYWGKNQSGMQARERLDLAEEALCMGHWEDASREMIHQVEHLVAIGARKQVANRLLEPFSTITVVATAESRGLANFFNLRCHPDAQPEFQILAYRMLDAYLKSNPRVLSYHGWHLPFCDDQLFDEMRREPIGAPELSILEVIQRICVGRLARISYLTHDGVRDPLEDFVLCAKLENSGHWSPFEHLAMATGPNDKQFPSNFGPRWFQYRKYFVTEFADSFNPVELMERKADFVTLE